jgi:hypothetical protein
VGEEQAPGAADRARGGRLVAQDRVQGGAVGGRLQQRPGAERPSVAAGHGRERLGLEPVGGDLPPHGHRDRLDQTGLGVVLGTVGPAQAGEEFPEVRGVAAGEGQGQELGPEPVLQRILARAGLALGGVGAALPRQRHDGGRRGVGFERRRRSW